MRLDKFLAEAGLGSRKDVKKILKTGTVTVNGQREKSDKRQIDPTVDVIKWQDEPLHYQEFYYYVLNKPAGVISATEDKRDRIVMDLLAAADFRSDLFPVGRLDKDTEGFLLLTNDGKLAHELLAPKKHVGKEYYAKVNGVMTVADVKTFEQGITLDGEKTRPAQLMIEAVDEQQQTSIVRIVLHEGKFHQVKRMVKACGKEVVYLKRIRMGQLQLPADLALGAYRQVTPIELSQLQG